jgi:hypothetical protein
VKEKSHKRPLPFFKRPSTKKAMVETTIVAIALVVFCAFLYFIARSGSTPSQ